MAPPWVWQGLSAVCHCTPPHHPSPSGTAPSCTPIRRSHGPACSARDDLRAAGGRRRGAEKKLARARFYGRMAEQGRVLRSYKADAAAAFRIPPGGPGARASDAQRALQGYLRTLTAAAADSECGGAGDVGEAARLLPDGGER